MHVGTIVLQHRQGEGTDNLKTTYDVVNTPSLAILAGKNPQGRWRLLVEDKERVDKGRILQFSVSLSY